jgi:lipoprotein-releasing system permease protein
MNSIQIIIWIIVALGPIATIVAVWRILTGPRIISKLMIRYLMKRRIAWVSLIAVMLCTAMVLIVISVMGGWLRMFRETNHDLIGDLIVYRGSLGGFSDYPEMLDRIQKLPEIAAVTPTVHTWGFAEIGLAGAPNPITATVEVIGLDLSGISKVNGFVKSLYGTPERLLAKADREGAEAAKFQAATQASLSQAYEGIPEALLKDPTQMAASVATLKAKAAAFPSWDKPLPGWLYHDEFPNSKGADPAKWDGIILGSGVIGLRADDELKDWYYQARVKLTIVKGGSDEGGLTVQDKTSTDNYWLIDTSHTNVFQVDEGTVYLPFDKLQTELDMQGGPYTDAATGEKKIESPRCNELLIRVKSGVDLQSAKANVRAIVDDVMEKNHLFYPPPGDLRVETWDENRQDFLNAVEHEKSLLVILFAIISIVAIFLIFCIFFMIVMEKTRDIGIIKSVGATGFSVAAIFLGYGLCIGVVGGGMGLLMAYLVVHNINELHAWMGRHLGVQIWSAKTYLFDKIPNTMDSNDVMVIVSVAILSSVLGALVPAIRAARMNPIEALRWE